MTPPVLSPCEGWMRKGFGFLCWESFGMCRSSSFTFEFWQTGCPSPALGTEALGI